MIIQCSKVAKTAVIYWNRNTPIVHDICGCPYLGITDKKWLQNMRLKYLYESSYLLVRFLVILCMKFHACIKEGTFSFKIRHNITPRENIKERHDLTQIYAQFRDKRYHVMPGRISYKQYEVEIKLWIFIRWLTCNSAAIYARSEKLRHHSE